MNFNCQKYDKTFISSLKLNEPSKVHFEGEVKPKISVSAGKSVNFICQVCNKEFKDNCKVKRHEKKS